LVALKALFDEVDKEVEKEVVKEEEDRDPPIVAPFI
jgi:hypothetical protein